jgi:hypothetical protein
VEGWELARWADEQLMLSGCIRPPTVVVCTVFYRYTVEAGGNLHLYCACFLKKLFHGYSPALHCDTTTSGDTLSNGAPLINLGLFENRQNMPKILPHTLR